ncbi:uncharacterized protein LOC110820317 [Carica papaya]|uniref:uncharacterized protein LOC110820317 n=1 Tax=Carica papaya TaxID=3649 RepID=UPI000B8C8B43|nr:uncharacterized protein LOC110820317 [Carica papaya]
MNTFLLMLQDLEFLHSESLLSEPLDIRNYFSSYEYESPELSTLDDLGRSYGDRDWVSIGERDMKKEQNLWITKKARNDNEAVGDKLRSYALKENISIMTDRDRSKDRKKLCSLNDFCFEESLEHKSFGSKAIEKPRSKNEEFPGGEEDQNVKEADLKSTNTYEIAGSTDKKLPKKLVSTWQFAKEKNLEGKVCTEDGLKPKRSPSKSSVSRFSIGKSNYKVSDKENKKENVDRGKDGIKDAKSLRRPEEMVVEGSKTNVLVRSVSVKDNAVKRKSLAETTNFHDSVAVEVTGKWTCPQKNKQKKGPPLKQLRLEHWLNRI